MRACVALLALAGAAAAAPLAKIPHMDCGAHTTLELSVKEGRVNVDGQVEFTSRLYFFGKDTKDIVFPPPIIRMHAGQRCHIRLTNRLSNAGDAACMADMAAMMPGQPTMFHCPQVTNLHTHGKGGYACNACVKPQAQRLTPATPQACTCHPHRMTSPWLCGPARRAPSPTTSPPIT